MNLNLPKTVIGVPNAVAQPVEKYWTHLFKFVNDCLEIGTVKDYIKVGNAYKLYEQWAVANNLPFIFKMNGFTHNMKHRVGMVAHRAVRSICKTPNGFMYFGWKAKVSL